MAKPAQKPKSFDRSIVEGPIRRAVWMLAWPTMLQNVIGGLQGIVDHAMVGHFVGFTGNAAIGVSWQIFLVVMVFISSLFTGMGVLVARFAGANEPEKVNRTVYQAFITAGVLSVGILAPIGYLLTPTLLDLVNATPEVRAEALPYLRIMFLFSFGMMVFFMLGGALRSAGDPRTPLKFGVALTILNITLNVILIRGLGPIPAFGTKGAAMGTVIAGGVDHPRNRNIYRRRDRGSEQFASVAPKSNHARLFGNIAGAAFERAYVHGCGRAGWCARGDSGSGGGGSVLARREPNRSAYSLSVAGSGVD